MRLGCDFNPPLSFSHAGKRTGSSSTQDDDYDAVVVGKVPIVTDWPNKLANFQFRVDAASGSGAERSPTPVATLQKDTPSFRLPTTYDKTEHVVIVGMSSL